MRKRIVMLCAFVGVIVLTAASCYLDPALQCDEALSLRCLDTFVCRGGRCVCPDDDPDRGTSFRDCSDRCADINSDPNHCGGCGTVCTGDVPLCSQGQCQKGCEGGQTACAGACVDLSTDRNHCGRCNNRCGENYTCGLDGNQVRCLCGGIAFRECGSGNCVNILEDAKNCGICGLACPTGQVCNTGACQAPQECTDPSKICGERCVNLTTNKDHCGDCNQVCSGNTNTCCPNAATKGACVDTQTDAQHCGSCGNACSPSQACQGGRCVCTDPQKATFCPNRGDCVDLLTDTRSCGSCEKSCAPNESCAEGVCCPQGQAACSVGGQALCKNLQTDSDHCGSCGKSCEGQICQAGACRGCTSDNDCPQGQGLACDIPSGRCQCGASCGWATTLSGQRAIARVFGVAVNAQRESYIAGEFSGTLRTADGLVLNTAGPQNNLFVAKLTDAGRILWIRGIPVEGATESNNNKRMSLATDSAGDVILATTVSGTANTPLRVDPALPELTLKGATDIFLAKLDRAGAWKWANLVASDEDEYARSIAIDGQDRAYITGYIRKSVSFGTINLAPTEESLYVAQLSSSDGRFLNAKNAIGKSRGESIAVDEDGRAYVTGICNEGTQFDTVTATNGNPTPDALVIAALSNTFTFQWAERCEGTCRGLSVSVQKGVGVLVGASFGGAIRLFGAGGTTVQAPASGSGLLVMRMRESNGRLDWTRVIDAAGTKNLRAVRLAADGSAFITGSYGGALTVGAQTLAHTGKLDGFLVTLDSQGDPLALLPSVQGKEDNPLTSIALDAQGSRYLVGYFDDTVQLAPPPASPQRDPFGTTDTLIWKIPAQP